MGNAYNLTPINKLKAIPEVLRGKGGKNPRILCVAILFFVELSFCGNHLDENIVKIVQVTSPVFCQ